MKTKSFTQIVSFKASAHDIYEALMDSKKHSKFTGEPAQISRRVGGKYSTYGGYASGLNIELIEEKKIVQTWRGSDWNDGDISEVTYVISPTQNGCKLIFTHKNIPENHYSAIKQGWTDFYWKPLKEMAENR